ncbi:Uncharacterised protein [Escherichia coli]|uniref:Lipoprotein n=1 Tax=Escherichia coli TaxID=562 RepID=A0A2X1JDJ0_ECOLX|nr:Uncharacterised protein [Escherichia coli]
MKSTTYALIAVAAIAAFASCENTGHMWQVTGHICYCWSAR